MPNNYANEPNRSRAEDIIQSILDEVSYNEEAQSRIEYLLIQLKNVIEQGGSGFSDDYAKDLSMSINDQTFVVTAHLIDQNGNNLGNAQTIDLPLESVVVGGSYNDNTKKVVLTLQNGNTVEFSVADLVSGLQSELSASNKLDPSYINYDSTHRAVSDTEKSTWNGKASTATATTSTAGLMSSNDKTKLDGITYGADVNVQSDWNVTNTTSDAYIKNKPTIPSASSTSPKMNGTASSGSSSYWSRADHVHPTDTSRQPALDNTQLAAVNSGIDSTKVAQIATNTSNISSLTTAVSAKIGATDYATQTTGGTVKVWTTTESGETTLHIVTE